MERKSNQHPEIYFDKEFTGTCLTLRHHRIRPPATIPPNFRAIVSTPLGYRNLHSRT
jgi:hypothetical protein